MENGMNPKKKNKKFAQETPLKKLCLICEKRPKGKEDRGDTQRERKQ